MPATNPSRALRPLLMRSLAIRCTLAAPVRALSFLEVMAQADMQRTGGISNAVCLQVDGGAAFTIMTSVALAYETKYLSQSAGAGGATTLFTVTPFVFPLSAG